MFPIIISRKKIVANIDDQNEAGSVTLLDSIDQLYVAHDCAHLYLNKFADNKCTQSVLFISKINMKIKVSRIYYDLK